MRPVPDILVEEALVEKSVGIVNTLEEPFVIQPLVKVSPVPEIPVVEAFVVNSVVIELTVEDE